MSVTQPDTAFPVQPRPRAVEASWLRRAGRALRTFARRSPMSAVWGCIAAGIIFMAVAAPVLGAVRAAEVRLPAHEQAA